MEKKNNSNISSCISYKKKAHALYEWDNTHENNDKINKYEKEKLFNLFASARWCMATKGTEINESSSKWWAICCLFVCSFFSFIVSYLLFCAAQCYFILLLLLLPQVLLMENSWRSAFVTQYHFVWPKTWIAKSISCYCVCVCVYIGYNSKIKVTNLSIKLCWRQGVLYVCC